MRGLRVKNIVRELNNEKVDIIHWSPNIEEFVTEALKPAELREVEVHQEQKRIQAWVAEDQLSLAIGKRGQNARLASRLTGWQIDIDAKEVETLSFDDQVADAVSALAALPGITDELAQTLVNSGFHSVEDLKQIEAGDLVGIPGLEENEATILTAANTESPRRGRHRRTPAIAEAEDAQTEVEAEAEPEEPAEEAPTEEPAPEPTPESEEAAE